MAANPWGNVGSLRNTGVEFTVNTINIKSKQFQWTSNIVFSLNRNKVLSLDTETGTLPRTFQVGSETATVTNTVVGQPIGQFWGYKVIGRFDKPEDFYYKDANGNVKPVALPTGCSIGKSGTWLGDYRFADLNGDGVIDNNDQTFIGNPEPKFTFGFGNTFSWKGWDLSLQFTGSVGNKVLNYNRRRLEVTGATSNLLTSVLNYAKRGENRPERSRRLPQLLCFQRIVDNHAPTVHRELFQRQQQGQRRFRGGRFLSALAERIAQLHASQRSG